jgi:cellulose synthase/poly-beta-1,6-N-acetylglucosamine synthase-like glycosyltransferase
MELKSAGFQGRYLAEYLAVGEAPEELRNILRQRSRWTKGHMQVGTGGTAQAGSRSAMLMLWFVTTWYSIALAFEGIGYCD